jgi:hypothetical protein
MILCNRDDANAPTLRGGASPILLDVSPKAATIPEGEAVVKVRRGAPERGGKAAFSPRGWKRRERFPGKCTLYPQAPGIQPTRLTRLHPFL